MAVTPMDNVGIVVEDIDVAIARLSRLGAALVDGIVNYEGICRLCSIRGPGGILVGLAE